MENPFPKGSENSRKRRSFADFAMKFLLICVIPTVLVSLRLVVGSTAGSTPTPSQARAGEENSQAGDSSSRVDARSLQKKADEAQARIRENTGDSDELKRAVKTNEVALAKQILLRNGFTAKDLENAKISLRTGGGAGGEDQIRISATCCDPKEITIRRTLENFTKTKR